MSRQLFVLFTMDVEPSSSDAGTSGPRSDEAGMHAAREYHEVLDKWGYRPTYFVHPDLARAQGAFFCERKNRGAALGLHLHPTKFAPARQTCEIGGLSAGRQREILETAAAMFEQGIGYRPSLFRPGCFSANDMTYTVLAELGFSGGSVSIPGRIWPDRFCVWAGAYPYAHFAHAAFRQQRGDLPFVDIPLSVDNSGPLRYNPVGFYHYPDLRPGGMYQEQDEVAYDRRTMLSNILKSIASDDPPLKTLVIDVHNDRDFTSPDSPAACHLRTVLEGIEEACAEVYLAPLPATYDEVVSWFREQR